MPGSWLHLGRRFFGAVTARDLDEAEKAELRALLSEGEFDLFMEQPPIDRRHGYDSAAFALDAGAAPEVVRAAALHDVAKRHARLGVLGRVLASVLIKAGLPLRGRFLVYRDHGPIGAAELRKAGSPPVVVEYAESHHGAPSSLVDPEVWKLLEAADAAGERTQSVRSHR